MSTDAVPDPTPGLTLTGERTLPGIPDERYWFERHVVAYLGAAEQVRATSVGTVLDAGCGEGYGLALLRQAGAQRVVGVDLDTSVVDHIRATYVATDPAIEAHAAELSALPLQDGEVELTVSFQVIEHLYDVPAYLASLRRVTAPGGQVWIATPNRLTFTPGSDVPVNLFHVREFTAEELRAELAAAGLEVLRLVGVHHGPRLRALEAQLGEPLTDAITANDPADWSEPLRSAVHATRADDFEVRAEGLDDALDLIAIARVPAGS